MKCVFHDIQEHTLDCKGEVMERHRNTAYAYSKEDKEAGKPDPNLMVSCEAHYEEDYNRFKELWDDYYRSRF